MDVGITTAAQGAQVDDFSERNLGDADRNQQPEVTSLPQEGDPDDNEDHPTSSDPNRKWSPLTSFWNEMGEDKPPIKKRKVGSRHSEDEFDELEEEEPSGILPQSSSGIATHIKYSEGSQSPLDGDSATTLNGGGSSSATIPVKRECTRCIRSGTPCVVGTGASCMRCRAMHQSCSLVAGRFGNEGKVEPGVKTAKQDARSVNGVSLRRRTTASVQGETEDLLDDVLNNMTEQQPPSISTSTSNNKKRRRSDDPPTTLSSHSRSQSPPDDSPQNSSIRTRIPDIDEIIELAAGSAGQLGPSGSSVLSRTRKHSQNHSQSQKIPRKAAKSSCESNRPNGGDDAVHSRSRPPPSRVMKALLMTSRAGRLYSEAIEELSQFIEEQRYL